MLQENKFESIHKFFFDLSQETETFFHFYDFFSFELKNVFLKRNFFYREGPFVEPTPLSVFVVEP